VRPATVCGADPKFRDGAVDRRPPRHRFVPGHEQAGEVVAVGDGVDRIASGDRVFGEPHPGCGACERCRAEYNLCLDYGDGDAGYRQAGHTMDGAFAEYVTVPADTLDRVRRVTLVAGGRAPRCERHRVRLFDAG
jgi:L-iditol 2-dehydrogenase